MDRALQIARTVGIWLFGLVAAGAVGEIIGAEVKFGYESYSDAGMLAGVCAFACFRLWMGERNSN
jgi:hypothetical protein